MSHKHSYKIWVISMPAPSPLVTFILTMSLVRYDKLVLGGKSLSLDGAEIIASKLNNIEGLREIDMADIIASRPEDGL